MTEPTSALKFSPLMARDLAEAGRLRDLEEEVLALFDEFRDPLLRYTRAFGLPVRDAEDVIQDVFLALFKHLRCEGSRSNLRAWLFRVAHNLALKRRARRWREPVSLVIGHAADTLLDDAPDPEQRMADAERRTRLVAVLNALPPRDRHCLYLRAEGLRYRDIARVLRISLGGVAKSISRSIARMQRADEG